MNVGFEDENDFLSFGAFSVAIYDEQEEGSTTMDFLGCVGYSQFWQDQTSKDTGFTIARVASGFLLFFASVATLICIVLQCFSKHGKSHLWNVMRFCYGGALVSQIVMYMVFTSDMCKSGDDEALVCTPGKAGVAGVLNTLVLLGMVFASFKSYPPRNPVFQCWGSQDDYDSDEGSTEEEDEIMREFKKMGDAASSSDYDDSVSLFGGSRASRKSRRSVKSRSSAVVDEENGLSSNDKMSVGSRSRATIPSRVEKYLILEDKKEGDGSVSSSKKSSASNSVASQKSKKSQSGDGIIVVETVESASVSTAQSGRSRSKYLPGVTKYLKNDKNNESNSKTVAVDNDGSSVVSSNSKKSARSRASTAGSRSSAYVPIARIESRVSLDTERTMDTFNFVNQLIDMTQLSEGGRRVKTLQTMDKVQIVDEYPIVDDGQIETKLSSDIVTVRTEYYDLGSRTTKEITHRDGSYTVVTTILVGGPADDAEKNEMLEKQPLNPSVQYSHSRGSVDSGTSSKYQVVKDVSTGETSNNSKKGNATKSTTGLGQGELCLSIENKKAQKEL